MTGQATYCIPVQAGWVLEINCHYRLDIPGEKCVVIIKQSYKQQRIHVDKWISVEGGLIKAWTGLIWLRISVADSYAHDENGVGKRQVFFGLCEQLSAKAKESSIHII